ncbi:MAG TPA: arylsulfotransferase family protein, partial [Acidimicrobiales bacterium]|nr:arylsulfotransferase family protein [Acidimicrobiales bacterium]
MVPRLVGKNGTVTAQRTDTAVGRAEPAPSWTRRRFLKLGAAAGVDATGYTGFRWLGPTASKPPTVTRFRSRPDLTPPAVTITVPPAPEVAPGYLFLAPKLGPGQLGPLITDDTGSPVWFHPITDVTAGLTVQQYQGAPVLTWWEGRSTGGTGQGTFVLADASYTEVARVACGNGYDADLHEMVITPEGTALTCAYASLPTGGVPSAGLRILESIVQEVDIESGKVLFEWHSHDHVSVDESYSDAPAPGDAPFDYFHLNSVDLDDDGDILVSGRNTHAVYKVDRSTGDIRWRLGGRRSDFVVAKDATFAWQHDVRRADDGTLTMFDNEASPKVGDESRGIVLRVDTATRTVSLDRQYLHPKALLAGSQGSVQILENG